ncbi:MAG: triose-phosphate isomerase [Planctomycetaceae bacterium]
MRRYFVAGNWKMNTTLASGVALAQAVAAEVKATQPPVDVAVCPPFPYLIPVRDAIAGSGVWLGAQNAYFAPPGAFTGEVALSMLPDVGCHGVILGHSERRQFFGDTDAIINQKVLAALEAGLGVIFCVGELLAERQSGQTEKVLETQMSGGLAGVPAESLSKLVIAYEPVWAIGTGVTATPDQAEASHAFLRKWLAGRFNSGLAETIRIQYGGSVKPDNAQELLSQPNVDGALVGGASLKADQFLPIIRAAAALSKAG